MTYTTDPVDWDSPTWGQTVHVSTFVPDAHDLSEASDE